MGSEGATFGDTDFALKSPVAGNDAIRYRSGRRDGVKRMRDSLRLAGLARKVRLNPSFEAASRK
jgi:hypothetical protein